MSGRAAQRDRRLRGLNQQLARSALSKTLQSEGKSIERLSEFELQNRLLELLLRQSARLTKGRGRELLSLPKLEDAHFAGSKQPAGAAQLDKCRMARLEESVRSTVADFLRLAFDAEHADTELAAARDKQAHQKEALPVLAQQYRDAQRAYDKMRAKADKCIVKAFTRGSVSFVLQNAGELFKLAEEHRPRTKEEKLAIARRHAERRRLKRRAKRIKRLRR